MSTFFFVSWYAFFSSVWRNFISLTGLSLCFWITWQIKDHLFLFYYGFVHLFTLASDWYLCWTAASLSMNFFCWFSTNLNKEHCNLQQVKHWLYISLQNKAKKKNQNIPLNHMFPFYFTTTVGLTLLKSFCCSCLYQCINVPVDWFSSFSVFLPASLS